MSEKCAGEIWVKRKSLFDGATDRLYFLLVCLLSFDLVDGNRCDNFISISFYKRTENRAVLIHK